jgi:hypothetical protein
MNRAFTPKQAARFIGQFAQGFGFVMATVLLFFIMVASQ